MLAGPQADTSWDYWRTYLSGDLPPLDLPTDRPRPPVQTGRGAVQSILIDEELADRLRGLAEKHHVALYTVLLAAFQTLLHRYTEQNDVLVGFPKAGRSQATARVVGYFVNPVVIRADFTENPRFADLLPKNQQAIEESSAHDWYPFSQLVQRIRPTRDPGRSPIFQVMFSWQKTTLLLPREHAGSFALGQGDHAVDLGGLLMRPIPMIHQVAPFDLTMSAAEVPGGLVATIEYNTDLFDAATIARPELTAERFLPNPFSTQPATRLYRTGDLARYLPDGNLEFLGRRDSQVKLRGYRIELGEIEATLAQHPQVKQAAVIVRQDQPGDSVERGGHQSLVAFWTPRGDPLSAGELRSFLRDRLPRPLIPAAFVMLDTLPLLPSGKVDRHALPAPDTLRPQQDSAFLGPRTNAERILVTIWQQVLGVEQVGVNDNFFELGGDSILSIQIIARATNAGLHLTPKHIFQAPTVAGLAALAEASAPMRIQPEQGAVEGELPLTPIQLWFFERNFPDPHYWNQSLMFITRQPLDPADLRSAVAALLAHHDALRLRYTRRLTGWQQIYAGVSSEVPCKVFDLSSLPEPQQTVAIEEHAAALQRSLNLSVGPLIRLAYFALGATRPGRLLIVIHHLAIDGISWRILLEDLQTVYRQLQSRQPIRLPPKTTAFRD